MSNLQSLFPRPKGTATSGILESCATPLISMHRVVILSAVGFLTVSGTGQAAATTYQYQSAAASDNWSTVTEWNAGSGVGVNIPIGGPTGVGNIAINSNTTNASLTTTLDTSGIIIGQVRNTRSGSRNWTIGANGNFDAITMDNTGGDPNSFQTSNAAINGTSSGNITFLTSVIMANTDLDFGSISNTNNSGSATSTLGTLGSTSINSSDTSGTRTLFLKNNVGSVQTANAGLTVNSAIGSANFGSAIVVSNQSTTTSNGANVVTLAGPVGGAIGVAAAVSISNTATSTKNFTISGALGATVTGVTQNSATSQMILSNANANYVGTTTVNAGTLLVSGAINGTSSVSVASGSLQLGASNVVNNAAPITLTGGTIATGGFSDTVGTLTINTGVSASVLNLGAGTSSLTFADSSAQSWSGTLSIYNWTSGSDHLFFGNTNGTLTSAQLNAITFYSDAGITALGTAGFIGGGEIAAVPEPGVPVSILGGVGLLTALGRRRRIQ